MHFVLYCDVFCNYISACIVSSYSCELNNKWEVSIKLEVYYYCPFQDDHIVLEDRKPR